MSLISVRKTTRKWSYKTCGNEVNGLVSAEEKAYFPYLLQVFQYFGKIIYNIWSACVTCLDVQKTSEIPHKRLLRKLSSGGDVESWIRKLLRVQKQSVGANEQFQSDTSRGMRSFTINDPEKIICSKLPKICRYPGVIQICQDEMTPERHCMKWCEAMRKWVLRSMQLGVLEGMICSGTWLASKLL